MDTWPEVEPFSTIDSSVLVEKVVTVSVYPVEFCRSGMTTAMKIEFIELID